METFSILIVEVVTWVYIHVQKLKTGTLKIGDRSANEQIEILETKKVCIIVQIQNSGYGPCCAGLESEILV